MVKNRCGWIAQLLGIMLGVWSVCAWAGGPEKPIKPKPLLFPTTGFYLGVQAGYGFVNYTNAILPNGITATSIKSDGIAPRLYAGYNFTNYIGAEFGIVYIKKPVFLGIPHTSSTGAKIKNNIVFLLAKGMLPIGQRVVLYAKMGIGYIVRGGFKSGSTVVLTSGNIIRPVYGLGFNVHIAGGWNADVSWLQAAPDHDVRLPATNFVGAGFFYQFSF